MIGGEWFFGGPLNPLNIPLAGIKAANKAKRVSNWAKRKGINEDQQMKLVKHGWKTFKSI